MHKLGFRTCALDAEEAKKEYLIDSVLLKRGKKMKMHLEAKDECQHLVTQAMRGAWLL